MNMTKTTEQFIQDAIKIHNNKYDYSLVKYINNKTKVKIICSIHGVFEQVPDHHLRNHGCKICGQIKNKIHHKTITEFIKQSNIIFNNKFDYSKFNYSGAFNKSIIICPIHGEFQQTPDRHIHTKHGCPLCAKNKQQKIHKDKFSLTHEEFVKQANNIHNNKYQYIEKYNGYHNKIDIMCKIHGIFKQTPSKHLNYRGCPECGHKAKKEKCDLYIFYDKLYDLYKIGVSVDYRKRLYGLYENVNKNIDIIYFKNNFGHNELLIHNLYKQYRINHPIKHGGYTEWFKFDNIDNIINNIDKLN